MCPSYVGWVSQEKMDWRLEKENQPAKSSTDVRCVDICLHMKIYIYVYIHMYTYIPVYIYISFICIYININICSGFNTISKPDLSTGTIWRSVSPLLRHSAALTCREFPVCWVGLDWREMGKYTVCNVNVRRNLYYVDKHLCIYTYVYIYMYVCVQMWIYIYTLNYVYTNLWV